MGGSRTAPTSGTNSGFKRGKGNVFITCSPYIWDEFRDELQGRIQGLRGVKAMYSSLADLEKRLDPRHLVALADDDNDGVADEGVINQAIADADAEIDSYVRSRYRVPFAPVPQIVQTLSAILAINNLFARRRETASPENQRRYEQAIALLQGIAQSRLDLGDAGEALEHDLPSSTTLNTDRLFRKDTLKEF